MGTEELLVTRARVVRPGHGRVRSRARSDRERTSQGGRAGFWIRRPDSGTGGYAACHEPGKARWNGACSCATRATWSTHGTPKMKGARFHRHQCATFGSWTPDRQCTEPRDVVARPGNADAGQWPPLGGVKPMPGAAVHGHGQDAPAMEWVRLWPLRWRHLSPIAESPDSMHLYQ